MSHGETVRVERSGIPVLGALYFIQTGGSALSNTYGHILTAKIYVRVCHGKNGPGKNGPAGPFFHPKLVRPDQFWSTKVGPAGPILATKNGPARPKVVRSRKCVSQRGIAGL